MKQKNKMGKTIDELVEGDRLSVTEIMEDKELLLYLGLTNDNNPLFIQHEYAKQTEYKQPIVPIVLLIGIMTSTVSKHLPGPGSHVVNVSVNSVLPVFHYQAVTFEFEVSRIDMRQNLVTLTVEAKNEQEDRVLDAVLIVEPPVRFTEKE